MRKSKFAWLSMWLLISLPFAGCTWEETSPKYSVRVAPNPFRNAVTCYLGGPVANKVILTVSNESQATIIRREVAPTSPGQLQVSLNFQDQPEGVYLLQVDFGDRVELVKLYKY